MSNVDGLIAFMC